jgi:uncharacterized membrane protein
MEENEVVTPVQSADITDDDKLWSLLSWIIWIVGLVALLMEDKKDRPFIKYNAVMSLAMGVVLTIIVGITSCFTFGLTVVLFIYPIYLGIQAYQGKWVEVPWLTDFVKQQGWADTP